MGKSDYFGFRGGYYETGTVNLVNRPRRITEINFMIQIAFRWRCGHLCIHCIDGSTCQTRQQENMSCSRYVPFLSWNRHSARYFFQHFQTDFSCRDFAQCQYRHFVLRLDFRGMPLQQLAGTICRAKGQFKTVRNFFQAIFYSDTGQFLSCKYNPDFILQTSAARDAELGKQFPVSDRLPAHSASCRFDNCSQFG